MGILDIFKKRTATRSDSAVDSILMKDDPNKPTLYEIKDGSIHFRNLSLAQFMGVDLKIGEELYRLCNWDGFHLFVMGLISGWTTNISLMQFRDSLKKGKIPDMLKNADEKVLQTIKNSEPPENFILIKNRIDNLDKTETQKILRIKEILGDSKLLHDNLAYALGRYCQNIIRDKQLWAAKKDAPVDITIGSVTYKKPIFAYLTGNEMELKLVRFFVFQDKITPEHAKLVLPVIKDFLDTIANQPGIEVPKETIELEIKYFKEYIGLLEKAMKKNLPIEPLFLK